MKYENLKQATQICQQIDDYKNKLAKIQGNNFVNVVVYENDSNSYHKNIFETGANAEVYHMQELQPITAKYVEQIVIFITARISALENELNQL